ncbi:hypothetical protein GR925_30820 [Streptomyces sp. HUCO-GS316]|uniref:lipoprotein n=1 Tax=Streptomyces sp. HUCO-GS316 TaxID=2692198 RepID=UPI001367B215|nr:hypothetical protein [Streptomyces sp. HUCO-GS316]
MLVGVGKPWRQLAHVALLAGVLAGCAQAEGKAGTASASPSESADSKGADVAVAQSGGSVGATGSACELPVVFDIAESWKAEAVAPGAGAGGGEDALSDAVADALLHQGPVTAACEVDAKPAGNIGYLRIWTGEPGGEEARTVLEAFVAAEEGANKEKYRTFKAGDLTGVEVEYLHTSELLDETKMERALAVITEEGPVVLHLGGMDTGEHEAMLPAYELAKRTLRVS